MRWVRLVLVSLIALAPASMLVTSVRADEMSKYGAPAKSPEEMAKKAYDKWKKTLKITDEQAPQFQTVMTDSYRKMADAKTAAAGDKAKMKESMKSIMEERDAALAQVLTEDQMKIYRTKIDKGMAKAKKHMSKAENASK